MLYHREKKQNNFTDYFQNEQKKISDYGEIKFFVKKRPNDSDDNVYAVISVFKIIHTAIFFHEASQCKDQLHSYVLE